MDPLGKARATSTQGTKRTAATNNPSNFKDTRPTLQDPRNVRKSSSGYAYVDMAPHSANVKLLGKDMLHFDKWVLDVLDSLVKIIDAVQSFPSKVYESVDQFDKGCHQLVIGRPHTDEAEAADHQGAKDCKDLGEIRNNFSCGISWRASHKHTTPPVSLSIAQGCKQWYMA